MQVRLVPIVLFGAGALLALKLAEAWAPRGEVGSVVASAQAQTAPPAPAAAPATPASAPAVPAAPGARPAEAAPLPSGSGSSEQAILERLADRRRQLDQRGRELEERETLLRAAERRLEERVEELRRLEGRIDQTVQARQQDQEQQTRGLIVMYENMKAKDAARIFDRLDMEVLISLVSRMNPRRVSEVLAEMQPEGAQRLTVELARRSGVLSQPRPPAAGAAPATPGSGPAQPAGGRELPRIDQRRPG